LVVEAAVVLEEAIVVKEAAVEEAAVAIVVEAVAMESAHILSMLCTKFKLIWRRSKKSFAHPAGDQRTSSPPPIGVVCVYAHALEVGMRVPLHPFFRDVLTHFCVALTQLTPNCWRIMAAFLVLCHSVTSTGSRRKMGYVPREGTEPGR
jgi:hypothetical protein